MKTEHKFLTIEPEDWEGESFHLEGLSIADLKCIYNALLLDTISDGERTLGAIDLIEKVYSLINSKKWVPEQKTRKSPMQIRLV